MNESKKFYSGNLRLCGNLHLPHKGAPCIITLHGLEGDKDRGKWPFLASRLYDSNYACFRFNFRGCGTGNEKSEGEFEDLTLTSRIQDYKSAIDFLNETDEIDMDRLGVIGSSLGGMTAIAAEEKRVNAVVTLGSPLKIPRYDKPKLPDKKGDYYELPSGRRFKKEFYKDVGGYDLRESIKKTPPIRIIQGDSDEIVPLEHARLLYDHAKKQKDLKVIPGGDHVFSKSRHLSEVVKLIINWFDKFL